MFAVPREWDGDTVIIIGGGPSIRALGQDEIIPKLEGRYPVIAINNAYMLAPWADVLYWADNHWLCDNWRSLHEHVGWRRITRQQPKLRDVRATPRWLPEIDVIMCRPSSGISVDPTTICGRNGGHNAINLAFLFGARRIVLLGFDLDESQHKQNWHELHTRPTRTDVYSQWRKDFAAAATELKKHNIDVVNTNPESRIDCFRFSSLNDCI
jgi:hypothetical protein